MIGLILLFFLNFGGLHTVNERGKIDSAKKKRALLIYEEMTNMFWVKSEKAISIVFVFLIRS